MQFTNGMTVLGIHGEKAGEVDRVVIDPRSGEVTHIVARSGFLFPVDKVIPVDMVAQTGEDELRLTISAEEAQELPDFLEVNFTPLDDDEMERVNYNAAAMARPYYYYPFTGGAPMAWGAGMPSAGQYAYPYKVSEDLNIPDHTVALKEGARVTGLDGKHVGDIEKIVTAGEKDVVTHMIVTKGFLNKEKKLIPAGWINDVKEDHVELSVRGDFIDRLRNYEE